MTYAESRLLLEFAQLQARVAADHDPVAKMDTVRVNLTSTKGYKDLRAWFVALSPFARVRARRYLAMQIEGTRDLIRKAEDAGEKVSLAEITFEIREEDQPRARLPMCPGSGRGIAGPMDDGLGHLRIWCAYCKASWSVDDIGFKIPQHEEQKA